MDFKDRFKGMFKQGSKKRPRHGTSSTDIPSSSIRGASPPPRPSMGLSTLIFQPVAPLPVSTSSESRQNETTLNETWSNLTGFVDRLHQVPVFAPMTAAMESLSWFIRSHENIITSQGEYQTLRSQLETLFKDLLGYFSSATPPTMTTSILNLCRAIETELRQVYGTQDRGTISRLMQAEHDVDKITRCYRRIQGHLERVMLNASLNILRILDKQATETQLRQLNPSMSARYNSADAHVVQRRECTSNTRKQVLSDLRAWKDKPDGEKVCWMNGMAGTGKTTITNTLCSILDQSYELGASFFCARSLPACRDVKLILPTIAYQLARFSDPFRDALSQVLDRDPDVHTKVLRVQFQRMILEPLQDVKGSLPTNLVIVVDALDECDDGNGVEQMLDVLLESASDLPIKFLLSSRPEYHIRDRIGKSNLRTQVTLHELDENMVKVDIETYLRAELASMSIAVTNGQLNALVERSGVLFIYAATVIRYLAARDGDPLERLGTVLQVSNCDDEISRQTKDIDGLYEAVLTSTLGSPRLERSERQRIQIVLHSVICAQEPLSIEALAGLLGLSSTKVATALKPLWSILHVSGRNMTDRVNVLHASFPEYLLDPNRSGQFACEFESHNAKMAGLCFRRIRQNIPQFNICGLESSYVFDRDVPDIDERRKHSTPMDLVYACLYWPTHLDRGGTQDEFATELDDFLSKRFLLWIEVLNLTERVERGIPLIEKAVSWLRITGRFESTILMAQDARRFINMFATSSVSRSTPHIYTSMLASWPAHQPIAHHYVRQPINLVQFKGIKAVERQFGLLSSIPNADDVFPVAYSSSGRLFATGTTEGTIQIWDAMSCHMTIDPIDSHTDWIQAVAISPDETHICSGSHDHSICIWDVQTGRPVAGPLRCHISWVMSVSFSPDGQWLASGSGDGIVCLWSTQNWKIHGNPLEAQDGGVWCVAFSPNSSILAAGSDSLVHLWSISTGQKIHSPLQGHTSEINGLAFLPDGNHLVSVSSDHTMRVWNVSTGQTEFGPFQEHRSEITNIACSADGSLLSSASVDSTIRLWDTHIWQVCSVVECPAVIRSMTFAPDNSRLLAACGDGCMRVWDVHDLAKYQVVGNQHDGHNNWVRSVAFLPCGRQFVSGSLDMTVRLWDQGGKLLHNLASKHNDRVRSVGVSANGDHVYAIFTNRMISVWETQTGQLVDTIGPIETDGSYRIDYQLNWPAAIILHERRVVCGSYSGRIYMWRGDKLCFEAAGHDDPVYAIAFSPGGEFFASSSESGEVILWDASSGERLLEPLTGHSGQVRIVTFSPDGSVFASGSGDTTVRLWSSDTGLMVGDPLRGHTGEVFSVAFSCAGRQLVSGSADMTLRMWDVATGMSKAVYRGHTDLVLSVSLSPDATQIVTGSADMTIRLSNIPGPTTGASSSSPCDVSSESLSGSPANIAHDISTREWEMDEDGWHSIVAAKLEADIAARLY